MFPWRTRYPLSYAPIKPVPKSVQASLLHLRVERSTERLAEYCWTPHRCLWLKTTYHKLLVTGIWCVNIRGDTVSSNSRFQTVLFQQQSANLSSTYEAHRRGERPMRSTLARASRGYGRRLRRRLSFLPKWRKANHLVTPFSFFQVLLNKNTSENHRCLAWNTRCDDQAKMLRLIRHTSTKPSRRDREENHGRLLGGPVLLPDLLDELLPRDLGVPAGEPLYIYIYIYIHNMYTYT